MNLIKLPNNILRQISLPVIPLSKKDEKLILSKEDDTLIKKMIKFVDDSQKDDAPDSVEAAVGVAAVQFGILKRIFYMNVEDHGQKIRDVLINPVIIGESPVYTALRDGEGCLSVGKKYSKNGLVHRKFRIVIEAESYFLKSRQQFTFTNYFAIVAQHELDHLNGILFIDRINKINPRKKINENEIIID